jgi:site-specific DNA-methyltransferase (adenine-specific)
VAWVVGDATIKGSETGTSFRQALYFIELGFELVDTFIYEKNGSSFPARRDSNRYSQIFEYVFVFSKGKPKSYNIENKTYIEDKNRVVYKTDFYEDLEKTWEGCKFFDNEVVDFNELNSEKGDVVIYKISNENKEECFKIPLEFMENGYFLHDTMILEEVDGYSFLFVFSYKSKPKISSLICDKPNRWAGSTSFGVSKQRNKDGELVDSKIKPVPDYSPRNNIWTYYEIKPYNIWKYNTGKNYSTKDNIAFKHPAIFPEKLCEDLIRVFSKEGDLVLDPFMGSGTTMLVCEKLNRYGIGVELDKEYFEVARKRIEKYVVENEFKQDNLF